MDELPIHPGPLAEGAKAIKNWLAYALDKGTRASELTDDEHAELANAAFQAIVKSWPGYDIMPFGDGVTRIRLPMKESSNA